MKDNVHLVNKNGIEIPEGILCTFGKKVQRGIFYFVGYLKEGETQVHVHYSSKRHDVDSIVSFQPVLNTVGRKIKQK